MKIIEWIKSNQAGTTIIVILLAVVLWQSWQTQQTGNVRNLNYRLSELEGRLDDVEYKTEDMDNYSFLGISDRLSNLERELKDLESSLDTLRQFVIDEL